MILASLAKIRWDSSSELELTAMPRNLANSFSLVFRLPSAMLAGIESAALKIWFRRDAYWLARIFLLIRSMARARACAFCQTCSFLKSDTPHDCAISSRDRHHFAFHLSS